MRRSRRRRTTSPIRTLRPPAGSEGRDDREPNGQNDRAPTRTAAADARRPGFTLVELLVVILIILLVSAVTLPSIISAISHRQVSEAARILQGALVGARDSAIHNNAPSGIRLLPDPTFNGINRQRAPSTQPRRLAMNRIVPLEAAPDYDEGMISIIQDRRSPRSRSPRPIPTPRPRTP